MSRPALLLLDEPSQGLAPLITQSVFEQLAALNDEMGTSILLVEQNAKLALQLADHAYVMETGTIVASGPASELAEDEAIKRAYLGI